MPVARAVLAPIAVAVLMGGRRDGALVAANIAGRIRVIGVDVRGLVLDALVSIRAISIRAFAPVARAVLAPVAVAVLVRGRRDGALVTANIAGRIRVIAIDVRSLVLDAFFSIRAVIIGAFVPVARAVLAPVTVAVLMGGRCVLPQRLDCDVSGDGHRGVHRILRTVDLPCLELLSFGRNKLALRQRILAAAQYLLCRHCGGDLLRQILGFGAAVRVKSDGMLVALFKRCSYGDVFLRLGEGIGIILNCKAGGSTVDGQRTEHIALIGCNGEHDKVVLAEQGRAVLGGFCGIHHRDCAVFTACSRYPVLRCTGHRYLYRNRLQGFLLRWDDNVCA